MPIYEYFCQTCSYKFELKQGIKEDPIATCSKCGKPVSRIISPPAIMFKGTGWYITDYSDKMKPPAGETSDPSSGTKKDAAAATPAVQTSTSTASASGGTTPSGTTPSST